MEETEVCVKVELQSGRRFALQLLVTPSVNCSEVLDTVKSCVIDLEFATPNSKWNLVEIWHGREKKIPLHENFLRMVNTWNNIDRVSFVAREKRGRGERRRKSYRAKQDKMAKKLLKVLSANKRELRKLRLLRLKTDISNDPIRQGIQLVARLSDECDALRAKKEYLSSEVFEMNHEATRLTEQLTVLRKNSQLYRDSLEQYREEGLGNKEEQEEKLRHLNEAVATVQSELELKQRMTELQDNKIQVMEDELSNLHMNLFTKENELEQMKELAKLQIGEGSQNDLPLSRTSDIKRDRDGGDSFKRRFINMNKKTKQQVKEEAKVFKEASKKGTTDEDSSDSTIENSSEGQIDGLSHQKRRSSKDDKKEKKGILRKDSKNKLSSQVKKKVSFGAEALILSAAGEGDLNLVKQCINDLGNYQVVSTKGATCLHNAVCSGNLSVIEYFISLGYDVNAQDTEGWAPLHCAAGFTHLPAMHLLIKSGASLYLRTEDDLTPMDLAQEASTDDNDDMDALNCYHYLMDCVDGLGKINDKQAYALFNYTATTPEELTFIKGELLTVRQRNGESGWWQVENAQGAIGFVPSTFLGLYPRQQIVL